MSCHENVDEIFAQKTALGKADNLSLFEFSFPYSNNHLLSVWIIDWIAKKVALSSMSKVKSNKKNGEKWGKLELLVSEYKGPFRVRGQTVDLFLSHVHPGPIFKYHRVAEEMSLIPGLIHLHKQVIVYFA